MSLRDWGYCALYLGVVLLLAVPAGALLAGALRGAPGRIARRFGFLERGVLRLSGVDSRQEMDWRTYAGAVVKFNLLGIALLYLLQRFQGWLPLNPARFPGVEPALAFNTAVSFVTNTNWQAYSGETTLSPLVQMLGLTVQNFLSAATGLAVLAALIRGFAATALGTVGNFWRDLVRATLYVLLPLSLLMAVVLVSQGVAQSFSSPARITTLEPAVDDHGTPLKEQFIPLGPVASQVAIKQLGSNGGGYYNVNSAHPLENPTAATNFLELLAILLLPAAACLAFGRMVGDRRQGWALLAAMTVVFVALLALCLWAEQSGNPGWRKLGVDSRASALQSGGNMEGKEARFGIASSALWAVATTVTSNGSVNSMHDSLTPLGGLAAMWGIQLGEVIFGGVGSGLYGMLVYVIVAVFIAGLMVGRTPEYLGKKIEAFDMKMATLIILIPPVLVLAGTALGVAAAAGRAGVFNPGMHGFSEVLYAFSSAANNNGSAFGGLGANSVFYNVALAVVMFMGRFWLVVPTLALAGSLASKRRLEAGAGTLPTHTPLFVILLVGVVIVVGALTFFPALSVGPVIEHLQMTAAAARQGGP